MSEYRAIRQKHSLLDICAHPEIAAEVTLQPIKRLDVDAAIIFADILLPLVPMGIELEYAAGEGPVIHNPIRDLKDVERLRVLDPEEVGASNAGSDPPGLSRTSRNNPFDWFRGRAVYRGELHDRRGQLA